ncbi:MAG: sulfur carrier protein ThiS [Actinomycetota bacterium]
MRIVVNGESRETEPNVSVAEVVASTGRDPAGRGTAVAVNGDLVARSKWNVTELSEGDSVEIVVAVQGG